MSVFVDVVPDGAPRPAAIEAPSSSRWWRLARQAGLPLLSLLVFFIVWQLAAASEIWNQTFVPYPLPGAAAVMVAAVGLVSWRHAADKLRSL